MGEEDNVKWLERSSIGVPRYIILLLIIILIYPLICIGIFLAVGNQIGVNDKYDIFKDILTLILAIAAVSIAAFGYITYLFLIEKVEKWESRINTELEAWKSQIGSDAEKRGKEFLLFSSGMLFTNVGYSFWNVYDSIEKYLFSINEDFEKDLNNDTIMKKLKDIFKTKDFSLSENAVVTKEKDNNWTITDGGKIYIVKKKDGNLNIYTKRPEFLDSAIHFTDLAYSRYIVNLDEKESRNKVSKCQTMNNLGYYLAARGKPEDKEFAKYCAEFIRECIEKYPLKKAGWQETYNHIFNKYSD
jgi:hypothetical protein